MGTEVVRGLSGDFARIRDAYRAEAWLYGTVTTKEFTNGRMPKLEQPSEPVPEGDFIAEANASLYYVSIDTMGEIGWESGTFRKPGRPDAHVIEVLTEQTPTAYRAYLREHGVSYILAGRTNLDCVAAAEKLYRLFGVQKLLICGGGVINWTFLQQGMVDELSLLLTPAVDGTLHTPSIFEGSTFLPPSAPVEFSLKAMDRLGKSGLHLVYSVQPNAAI